jgi:hypothetical protein
MTGLPGSLRRSKFMQALVFPGKINQSAGRNPACGGGVLTKLLTISAKPAWSLCLPLVITSHCCAALPSHLAACTGVRFSQKSPEVGSTKRHWPVEVHSHRSRMRALRCGITGRLISVASSG